MEYSGELKDLMGLKLNINGSVMSMKAILFAPCNEVPHTIALGLRGI